MISERAEIIEKIIAEFVAEMNHDFHLKWDEELLLVKECITQEGINTTNSNISSPIYIKLEESIEKAKRKESIEIT